MTIAVDFDGTIVEHKYPAIGKEKPFAIETLKQLADEGNKLILWTSRDGELLQEALDFCHKRGLEPEWGTIYEMISEQREKKHKKCRKGLFGKLFR